MKRLIVILMFSIILIMGCEDIKEADTEETSQQTNIITFDQGWSDDERLDFYNTSQGSQLIPYSWFLALEQSDNDNLFRSNENFEKLGYIPQQIIPGRNPDGLPIGFIKDDNIEEFLTSALTSTRLSSDNQELHTQYKEWLGLTCAACHTSEVNYKNHIIRIDGGPSMADFQALIQSLSNALTATISDDEKLTRFAKNVLAEGGYNETEQQHLKIEMMAYNAWLNDYIQINYDNLITPYGYGRLDAFGAILNRVTSSFIGIKENAAPANAPVSYPFLWNDSQLNWVQWNGSANNHLGRNVGEVSGVFAYTIVNTTNDEERFYSSAKIVNLDQLEQLMSKLDSPKWSAPLPEINETKAAKGKVLFAQNCAMCHGVRDENGKFPMTEPNPLGKQFIEIHMTALDKIGTDPLMAMNFVNPALNVDPGAMRNYLPEEFKDQDKVPRGVMLTTVVGKVVEKQLNNFNPPLDDKQKLELAGYHFPVEKGGPKPPNLVAYKARPLNGIWATAPYLHNGSVPTLYQLLLPDTEREKSFHVGGTTLNTEQVGFESNQDGNSFLFNSVDKQGNPIPGNSNAGHSGKYYTQTQAESNEWRDYTEEERYQLIEYMKTL